MGNFLGIKNIGDSIDENLSIIDLLPSTGLQIKYYPSISIIYFGFGLLMITTSLSYLPYTQIWIFEQNSNVWVGGSTNRGKIQLEIEFENLIRSIEASLLKNVLIAKK
jgi:cytochrome c biogenesis protein